MPINSFLYPGAKVTTVYDVANSCRFDDGSSPHMTITPGSNGNTKIFTASFWVKRGNFTGSEQEIISTYSSGSDNTTIRFLDTDALDFVDYQSGSAVLKLVTTRVFRDPSAWYHIVCNIDTNQAVEANRAKIYVNGVQETSFSTNTIPAEDATIKWNSTYAHYIGNNGNSGAYFDGYLAEVCVIDGTAYAASDFGEFDEDSPTIWKPKDVSGLTFGTNGFYLDFEDSANLGNDANGGTDLTEVNLAATDQATDTPTNNFCTMNPLDNYYQGSTFSEGNCQVVTKTGSGSYSFNTATFWLTSGKWYWEIKYSANTSTDHELMVGIASSLAPDAQDALGEQTNNYAYRTSTGQTYTGGSGSSYGDTWTLNDIVGVYLDLDNNKLYFSKNGTLQNSGTGVSITDPASTTYGAYSPAFGDWSDANSLTGQNNFGGCPSFSISSSVSDDNGFGSFEYSPNITGDGSAKKFYALCTKNLAEYG